MPNKHNFSGSSGQRRKARQAEERIAANIVRELSSDSGKTLPRSPEPPLEERQTSKFSAFWGSTPVWGAIGVLIGAIASQLSLKLLFVAAWGIFLFEFIRVGFFKRPMSKVFGNIVTGSLLAAVFFGLWLISPRPKEPATLDQMADAFANAFAKKISGLAKPEPKPTSAISRRTPINPCAGKGFLDAYKNICDGQVGQWIIDEATKVEELAEKAMTDVKDKRTLDATRFFFTGDFKGCCADDVKDLRTEVFRRLGPAAKEPEETRYWETAFPDARLPWSRDQFDPWSVKQYAPYLRLLGIKLKRKDIPRIAPYDLPFSETSVKPHTPMTLPGAALAMADQFTNGTPLRPFESMIIVTPRTSVTSGYIAVEFVAPYAGASCDVIECKLPETRFIDNREFATYIESKRRTVYAVELGRTAITPQRPLQIEVHSNSPPKVSKVTYFDQ